MIISTVHSCQNTTDDKIEKLNLLANRYYLGNNYVGAIKLFTELIEIDSSNGEYYYKRGYCNTQIDSVEMSTYDYLKSVSYGYRLADSYYNIGLNYLYTFKYSEALKYFKKALELSPNDTKIKDEIDMCKKLLESNKTII